MGAKIALTGCSLIVVLAGLLAVVGLVGWAQAPPDSDIADINGTLAIFFGVVAGVAACGAAVALTRVLRRRRRRRLWR